MNEHFVVFIQLLGINRYIVECKSGKSHTDEYFEKELIDT